jgi:hypothetical protein
VKDAPVSPCSDVELDTLSTWLATASDRRLLSLANLQIARCGWQIPAPLASDTAFAIAQRRAINCIAIDEAHGLIDQLRAAGIAAMAFKGQFIGAAAYGDPYARDSGDIDIVVHPVQVASAVTLLQQQGYSAAVPLEWIGVPLFLDTCSEFALVSPKYGFEIDLHWRFCAPWWAQPIDAEDVLATQSIQLLVDRQNFPWCDRKQVWMIQLAHVLSCEWRESKALIDLAHSADALTAGDWQLMAGELSLRGAQNAFDAAALILLVLFDRHLPPEIVANALENRRAYRIAHWTLSGLGRAARHDSGLKRLRLAMNLAPPSARIQALVMRTLWPTHLDFEGCRPTHATRWGIYGRTLSRRIGHALRPLARA